MTCEFESRFSPRQRKDLFQFWVGLWDLCCDDTSGFSCLFLQPQLTKIFLGNKIMITGIFCQGVRILRGAAHSSWNLKSCAMYYKNKSWEKEMGRGLSSAVGKSLCATGYRTCVGLLVCYWENKIKRRGGLIFSLLLQVGKGDIESMCVFVCVCSLIFSLKSFQGFI